MILIGNLKNIIYLIRKLQSQVKNINYVSNNVENLKNNEDNFEIMAALGYYGEIELQNKNNKINQFLTPKIFSEIQSRQYERNQKIIIN